MAAAAIERQAVSVHQTAPLAQLDAKLSMHGHSAASKVSRQACSDRLGQMPMQHRCAPEVVPFEGNLDELVRLCRAVAPGSVIDLQGATVQHTNNAFTAPGRSCGNDTDASCSATSNAGVLSASSNHISLCAASISACSNTVWGSSAHGELADPTAVREASAATASTSNSQLLSGTSLSRRRSGAQRTRSLGTYPPACAAQLARSSSSAMASPGSLAASASMSPQSSMEVATPVLAADSGPDVVEGGISLKERGSLDRLPCLTQPADGAIAPRTIRKTPYAAESFRQSCSFDPKLLLECLQPSSPSDDTPFVALRGDTVTVCNGTLCLLAGCVLIVEGRNMSLRHLEIVAEAAPGREALKSTPLLLASLVNLDMEGVSVRSNACGHALGVGAGATVKARKCCFSDCWTCGAVVRGADAQLTATSCRFERNGQDGCSVGGGANVMLDDCTIARNAMLGVGAAGAGTSVTAVRCVATGSDDHGFAASGGATLTLDSCDADANNIGVLALGAATRVRAVDCVVQENRQGVHAREGAAMELVDCSLSRNRVGACACDADTHLAFSGCSVLRSAATGVQVFAGSRCTLSGGAVSRNGGHGIALKHKHSTLTARGAALESNSLAGVHVSVMARVQLVECQLQSNKVSGLQATDHETEVDVERCSLSHNNTIGAFVNKGSALTLRACTLNGNGSSGCEVRDRTSTLVVCQTSLASNGRVGLYVHSAARAQLEECVVVGNEAFGVLCGGRTGTDIGGGMVTLGSGTTISDGKLKRHGGRIFVEEAVNE